MDPILIILIISFTSIFVSFWVALICIKLEQSKKTKIVLREFPHRLNIPLKINNYRGNYEPETRNLLELVEKYSKGEHTIISSNEDSYVHFKNKEDLLKIVCITSNIVDE